MKLSSVPRNVRLGLALLLVMLLFSSFAPMLSSHSPWASESIRGATSSGEPIGPCSEFWFGTDRIFRDLFVRLAIGMRTSLLIAVGASFLSVAIGGIVGMIAGFFQGSAVDFALMRLVDLGLSFPFLLLVMAVGASVERTNAWTIFWISGLTGWLSLARLARSKTISLRNNEYIVASRSLGGQSLWIGVRHIFPELTSLFLLLFLLSTPQLMVADSVLSYLGAGISPPEPTLGYMLFEGQDLIGSYPWMFLFPLGALALCVLGFHLIGESLRGVLDEKKKGVA